MMAGPLPHKNGAIVVDRRGYVGRVTRLLGKNSQGRDVVIVRYLNRQGYGAYEAREWQRAGLLLRLRWWRR